MNRKILFASVVLAVGVLMAGETRADLISNGGLEDSTVTNTTAAVPPDWTTVGTHYWWIANTKGDWAKGSTIKLVNDPNSPSGDVDNFVFEGSSDNDRGLYQVTSVAVQPNTTYTLTLDVGALMTNSGFWAVTPAMMKIDLGAGNTFLGNLLPSYGSSTPSLSPTKTAGDWKTWSYTFVTAASVPSENVRVDIDLPGSINLNYVIAIDNVHLTATPEPGTLLLLATGLIGLVCYAWRKRK